MAVPVAMTFAPETTRPASVSFTRIQEVSRYIGFLVVGERQSSVALEDRPSSPAARRAAGTCFGWGLPPVPDRDFSVIGPDPARLPVVTGETEAWVDGGR